MAKQEGEPKFEAKERLFRRLIEAWIQPDGRVDPAAIQLPECSVDRAAFATEAEALARGNEFEIAVANVEFSSLPDSYPPESDDSGKAKTYEVVVKFDPVVEADTVHANPAHSQIEIRQQGSAQPRRPNSATLKLRIKNEIAGAMRVGLRRSDPPK